MKIYVAVTESIDAVLDTMKWRHAREEDWVVGKRLSLLNPLH